MGWNFRKSISIGPFRINLSKSGIGYSAGFKGFRVGKDAKGQTYTQTTIPGTGIYRKDYYSNSTSINSIPNVINNQIQKVTIQSNNIPQPKLLGNWYFRLLLAIAAAVWVIVIIVKS